jgi:thiol-disulfide isomerase/thioredoxin
MRTASLLTLLFLAAQTEAQDSQRPYTLMVGDAAPALTISSWVGDAVKTFEPGQTYVLDFFATWCGPCREAMPAVSALHTKHGAKVKFIAVDVWDYQDRVPAFVAKMGDKLNYPVALDQLPGAPPPGTDNVPKWCQENGATSLAWMTASGMADSGIPALFVVDGKGRIAWIGDDVGELGPVLTKVVDGTWPLATEAASYAAKMRKEKQGRALVQQLRACQKAHDLEGYVATADKLVAFDASYHHYAGTRFQTSLLEQKDKEGAYAFARAQLQTNTAINAFGQMSYVIVFMSGASEPADLELAEQLATKANTLAKGERPSPLETLARIAFLRGDKQKAVEFQTKAVAKCKDDARAEAEKRLQEYQAK